MNKIRKPAVSDLFYPADPDRLKQMVKGYLESVTPGGDPPKGDCPEFCVTAYH
ncbi:MAG: hypothetical protein KZQ81_11330 [Candidatus Thiodiazotropha sp. (ex Rostrolucina anterorostrata)]|nr:hypothetical protein [Candidatus Thiodiazotropha sp. (ex Rostrolucina anterorostrata)]